MFVKVFATGHGIAYRDPRRSWASKPFGSSSRHAIEHASVRHDTRRSGPRPTGLYPSHVAMEMTIGHCDTRRTLIEPFGPLDQKIRIFARRTFCGLLTEQSGHKTGSISMNRRVFVIIRI
jgi:hypothetical protein